MPELPASAKVPFDSDDYSRRARNGPCFICAMLQGDAGYRHHIVFEDNTIVVFLSRFPTLRAYCLVAPKQHIESWIEGLSEAEFLSFQRIVYLVAKAVSKVVPTERMYSMSLGSQQGNSHLHWHVAPLPPGVPYHEQQLQALTPVNGILDLDDEAQRQLAATIAGQLDFG